jgi:alkanesulfonate monooxygenase SsuD/methylene tetrahydromethanopterin reductase-like flavin-dependent oxidoreductase (luciferase family)
VTTTPRFGTLIFSTRSEGPSDADILDRALAAADAAEAAGFDEEWVTEHHFGDTGINPSALTPAAFPPGRSAKV